MAQNDKPVRVTLSCEARPSQETTEIEREVWDSWTPEQRLRECDEMLADHMSNAGGSGWWIEDEGDAASVGDPDDMPPDPLRELAEWLADMHDPAELDAPRAALTQIRARARLALGRNDG